MPPSANLPSPSLVMAFAVTLRAALAAHAAPLSLSHVSSPSLLCRVASPRLEQPLPAHEADGEARRRLDVEFASIAVPALAQFAAEPLAGLVDTAYLGRLGATALGGTGIAIGAHFATAKLFNDPLLRTSISIVASGDGAARLGGEDSRDAAISAALVLALCVGLLQLAFFALFAPRMVSAMGAGVGSPMRPTALSYLRVRALGMPAATLWLCSNGVFRGLGDTRTPLVWALLFSLLNALLDPLFIFPLGLGAAGAAAGTGLAQSIALVGLLRALSRRTGVSVSPLSLLSLASLRRLAPSLRAYGRAGVLVFVRTVGKVWAYTYCTRLAASLGAVSSAAHLLCFNLGVVLSQLCESVAVATQTLLARALGSLDAMAKDGEGAEEAKRAARRDAWHVIGRGVLVGGGVAGVLTAVTAFRPAAVVASLTTDVVVRETCASIMAPVLLCQLFKGLAFPANGVVMGGLDWGFATAGIWLGSALCVGLAHLRAPPTLHSIWWGFAAFMASQTVLSVGRVLSRTGPWGRLYGGARGWRGTAAGSDS